MSGLKFSRYGLCSCVAAALLAGCGGSQPPVAERTDAPQRQESEVSQGLRALYSFKGDPDGEQPNSNVVAPKRVAPFPQVVGTTEFGGYENSGTVYGLTKNGDGTWTESLVYQFGAPSSRPNGIAIPGPLDGMTPVVVTLYGTGISNGAIAVLRPDASGAWTLASSYSFGGSPDGAAPFGPVVADRQGNFYGTTGRGGTQNDGTVYRLRPTGSSYTESILYSFQGAPDGDYPVAGLVVDGSGALYGTTEYGGTNQDGTVFKLTPSGSHFTESLLHSFRGKPDGSSPMASLCLDQTGALYGTTALGGGADQGTVFKLSPIGGSYVESLPWQFGLVPGDGKNPEGKLLVDTRGVIYGTTINGGSGSGTNGTFFTLKPSSKSPSREKVYDFDGQNGSGPAAGPGADRRGKLFVPTVAGGGPHYFGAVSEAPVTAGTLTCQ